MPFSYIIFERSQKFISPNPFRFVGELSIFKQIMKSGTIIIFIVDYQTLSYDY